MMSPRWWLLAAVLGSTCAWTLSSSTGAPPCGSVCAVSVRTAQRRIGTESAEEVAGLDELEQSLGIILRTPEGSQPGRPHFGSRLVTVVDRPALELTPLVASEVPRAVRVSDPRISVHSARVVSISSSGSLVVRVVWSPADGESVRSSDVQVTA